MYKLMWPDDNAEYTNMVFSTVDDAEFYLSLDKSLTSRPVLTKALVFSRKFWYSLIPYVFWFDEDGDMKSGRVANPIHVWGMMDSQFTIKEVANNRYTMVAFWDATKDFAKATILAKSLYEGWKAGKNANV